MKLIVWDPMDFGLWAPLVIYEVILHVGCSKVGSSSMYLEIAHRLYLWGIIFRICLFVGYCVWVSHLMQCTLSIIFAWDRQVLMVQTNSLAWHSVTFLYVWSGGWPCNPKVLIQLLLFWNKLIKYYIIAVFVAIIGICYVGRCCGH